MPAIKEQLLSRTVYDTDGTTTIWEFAFSGGYLAPSHVKAYTLNAVGARTDLVINPATDLVGQFQLRVQPALAVGLELVIYRDTPKDLPLVDFNDASGFSEIALDTNAKQAVFIAAETTDTVTTSNRPAAIDARVAAQASAARVAAGQANIDANTAANAASAASNAATIAVSSAAVAAGAVAAFATDIASPTGSALVGFRQVGAGATATNVQAKLREFVSVKDFGAVGDGVADDGPAWALALASGAALIEGVQGQTYRVTDTVMVNRDNVEINFNGSTLILDDSTASKNIIAVGDGVTQKTGIKIKNGILTRNQIATGGAAISLNHVGVVEITGNRIFGNNSVAYGIYVARGIIIDIRNNYIDNTRNDGIYLVGTGVGANRTVDVTIYENRLEGGISSLVTWDYVEGLYVRSNIFFNTAGACVSCNASTNEKGLFSFKFQQNDFDTGGATGMYIDKINNIQVTDNWFSNLAGIGLDIGQDVDSIVVSGNQIYPGSVGVRVAGKLASITGNVIAGGSGGLVQVSPSARNTAIVANTMSGGNYGIALGATSGLTICDNDISGFTGAAITGETLATDLIIANNRGDTAVNVTAFIPVGASPFTYTAGPRAESVYVSSGVVSSISVGGNPVAFSSDRCVNLPAGKSMTVTYSSVPLMVKQLM